MAVSKHEKKRPRIVEMLPEPLELFPTNSTHPDMLRVSFSNGSTQIYELKIQQPHPIIRQNLEIRKMCIGYQMKGDSSK